MGTSFVSKNPPNYEKDSANGRYTILKDHGPDDDVNIDLIPDLIPKYEPRSKGGNKSPYEVWGKKYWVMDSAKGFTQTGMASWYGKKFHGHKTSNGEIYDMYKFSAAHRNLPLPTYLKVTNLDNGRQVIVRVNDRGPFHSDRIIDLSYAAAVKLGYDKKGLARVRIEAVSSADDAVVSTKNDNKEKLPPIKDWRAKPDNAAVPDTSYSYQAGGTIVKQPSENTAVPTPMMASSPQFTHLQVGAFSSLQSAEQLKQKLLAVYDTTINVFISEQSGPLYKVMVGPYEDSSQMNSWNDKLQQQGFGKPIRVNLSP